jgi:branched-chain amino acid transport system permease protein
MWAGALLLQFLPNWAENVPGLGHDAPQVVQGLILILVMFVLPGGLVGLVRQLAVARRRLSDRSGTGVGISDPTAR